MNKAKFVTKVSVQDPDQPSSMVNVSIYKHENGGMFGVDSSYIEQLDGVSEDDDITVVIPDPFENDDPNNININLVELHED
jgi:hypothetical protein